MAAINKNFIIKNGLEVKGNRLIVDIDENKVGIGTSVIEYDLHVYGGIGATDARVTGITTVNELHSTTAFLGIGSADTFGVGGVTVLETVGGETSLSGITTLSAGARSALETKLLTDANGGQLTLTGVATVGTVQIAHGEIRATSGVVTYFGDGSGLTGTLSAPNMGVGTDAYVGAGTTLILFSGSSVSSVEADRTSGIATVTIEKVSPSGAAGEVQFAGISSFNANSSFTYDGTNLKIGSTNINGRGIEAIDAAGIGSFAAVNAGLGTVILNGDGINVTSGIITTSAMNLGIAVTLTSGGIGAGIATVTELDINGGGVFNPGGINVGFITATNFVGGRFDGTRVKAGICTLTSGGAVVAGVVTARRYDGPFTGPSKFQITSGGINNAGVITATSLNATGNRLVAIGNTFTFGGIDVVGYGVSATSYTTKGTGSYQVGGDTVINSDRKVQRVILDNYSEKYNDFGNTGTTPSLDLADGQFIKATLNANAVFTFGFGTGRSDEAMQFTLHLVNDGVAGRSITWPATVKWPNGSVPIRTTTAGRADVYTFYTYNGGSTWYGILSIYNYA